MAKALTHNDVIVQIESTEFDVHSDLTWRDCTAGEAIGDTWNGSSWDAATAYVPVVDDIREECRRRIELDAHDLSAQKATPPAASTDYIDDCVTACETLEGTLPIDYLTSSTWPALP